MLEHRPNLRNLEQVKNLLRTGELKRKYGGMIFTSQRAVEAFAQVVQELEDEVALLRKNSEENHVLQYSGEAVESSMTIPIAYHDVAFPTFHLVYCVSFSLYSNTSYTPSISLGMPLILSNLADLLSFYPQPNPQPVPPPPLPIPTPVKSSLSTLSVLPHPAP